MVNHPDGASLSSSESSPPAASAPVSGGAQSLDPVEATPSLLPAPETVSSTFPSPPLALSLVSRLAEKRSAGGEILTNKDELRIHFHPDYCISIRYSTVNTMSV